MPDKLSITSTLYTYVIATLMQQSNTEFYCLSALYAVAACALACSAAHAALTENRDIAVAFGRRSNRRRSVNRRRNKSPISKSFGEMTYAMRQ